MWLYPAEWRAEYASEMREVFREAATQHPGREIAGLLCGAIGQRWQQVKRKFPLPSAFAMAAGLVVALGIQIVVYVNLLPHMGKTLQKTIQELAAFLMLFCVVVGAGLAQQPVQDPATLELARSIYDRAVAGVKTARTLEELRKSAAELDTEDWVSIDRFGRTVLTGHDQDRELESMLELPRERRSASIEIIWVEQDRDRLTVLMWIAPSATESIDSNGIRHRIVRGTLVHDLFAKTPDGWKRIRHEKLTSNGMILAVDGVSRFAPPVAH